MRLDFSTLRPPIIVIGMHRSGTSLVSRILRNLQVLIGNEIDQNYEAQAFKEVNMALLRQTSATWPNPYPFIKRISNEPDIIPEYASIAVRELEKRWHRFGEVHPNDHWSWKDPRTTITMKVWLHLFPEAKVIHCVRNGIDVALSLQRREPRRYFTRGDTTAMFPPFLPTGYKLWTTYLDQGLAVEKSHPNTLHIKYEDIITTPHDNINRLANFIGIDPPPSLVKDIADNTLRSPAKRSSFEDHMVRWCFRLKLMSEEPLIEQGYQSPS